MYRSVILSASPGWSAEVRLLVTPRDRLTGLLGDHLDGVLLLTRSIHTFTMSHPIRVCLLDADGTVITVRDMAPRRVLFIGSLQWVLEVGGDVELPTPGTRVTASTMPVPCPEH